MKKRNISLLLTGAMVLTLAAGATAHAELYEADYSEWIPEETVTLDVYDQLANYSGEQTGWFGQLMLERFNVKLNIIPESDGTYDNRMESGNLGDLVIWGNDSVQYLHKKKLKYHSKWKVTIKTIRPRRIQM